MSERELTAEVFRNRTYVIIWLCLLALTATTVAVAKMHLTHYAVAAAMGIATTKAGLVTIFFMHLRQEPLILKIMLFLVLAALALIIALTFSDVGLRYR
jgi:cytochrome c oxidase subunit IV